MTILLYILLILLFLKVTVEGSRGTTSRGTLYLLKIKFYSSYFRQYTMDTVCSLQYKPGVLLGKSIYFIFTCFHIELLVHSQEICKVLGYDSNPTLNLSISVLTPYRISEISEISLTATTNPATLSLLRSISKISPLGPPVNHSIFRTEA